THSLHGYIRRSEPARRDADNDHLAEGVLRNGVEHRARRAACRHPTRGLLSWLARLAHPSGETRRGRDSGLTMAAPVTAEPGARLCQKSIFRKYGFTKSMTCKVRILQKRGFDTVWCRT